MNHVAADACSCTLAYTGCSYLLQSGVLMMNLCLQSIRESVLCQGTEIIDTFLQRLAEQPQTEHARSQPRIVHTNRADDFDDDSARHANGATSAKSIQRQRAARRAQGSKHAGSACHVQAIPKHGQHGQRAACEDNRGSCEHSQDTLESVLLRNLSTTLQVLCSKSRFAVMRDAIARKLKFGLLLHCSATLGVRSS